MRALKIVLVVAAPAALAVALAVSGRIPVQAQARTARQVVDAAAAALGGAEKLRAVRNITLVGYGQYAYQFGGGRITGEPTAPEKYIAANDPTADLTAPVERKHSRWSVEAVFRDTKQYAALEACQGWTDPAMVRHVALVLLTFAVLQMLRRHPQESVGAVKERWQLDLLRAGQPPPTPIKATPPHLRATA